MKSNEIKMHGGKRAGAGRPKNPDSIRSQLAQAKERAAKLAESHKRSIDGSTFYSIWAERFLQKQDKDIQQLITVLRMAPDKNTCGLTVEGEQKGFLSLHSAMTITKLIPELRSMILIPRIKRFVAQYKDEDGMFGDYARAYAQWLDSV
jgi:hypothetical protein